MQSTQSRAFSLCLTLRYTHQHIKWKDQYCLTKLYSKVRHFSALYFEVFSGVKNRRGKKKQGIFSVEIYCFLATRWILVFTDESCLSSFFHETDHRSIDEKWLRLDINFLELHGILWCCTPFIIQSIFSLMHLKTFPKIMKYSEKSQF